MAARGGVVIIGANGMLGRALVRAFPGAAGVDLPSLDITDGPATAAFIASSRPSLVVNAAARTDVDGCEGDPGGAFAVNGDGAGNVARACASAGARIVHLSTDYVFDGLKGSPYSEDDPVNPRSVYGKSKLAGEEAVRAAHPDHLIVRTSWLFGAHGRNFVDAILNEAAAAREIEVVGDQRGRPTYAPDLAGAIRRLAGSSFRGTVHVANDGVCSWCEYARAILELAGAGGVSVREIESARLDRAAARPPYSALDCSRYASITGAPMRHWREALGEYLDSRRGR